MLPASPHPSPPVATGGLSACVPYADAFALTEPPADPAFLLHATELCQVRHFPPPNDSTMRQCPNCNNFSILSGDHSTRLRYFVPMLSHATVWYICSVAATAG